MNFIIITIAIVIGCNAIGFIYSYLVLYTNLFKEKRIQHRDYKPGLFFKRLPLILLNLFLLLAITCTGLYFIADRFIMDFPPVWVIALQVLAYFLIDDLWFYFIHRWLHENKYLMKTIHAIHHKAIMPFPLEYIYVHPLEWMIGSIGTFIGLGFFMWIGGGHAYAITFWLFIALRNLHEIEIHSDVKSWIGDKIPLLAPTEHHDLHHARSKGNYASTLLIWDKFFGTELKAPKK